MKPHGRRSSRGWNRFNLAQIPRSLADCGVERAQIKTLANEAVRQWTVRFNPRPLTEEDFVQLYEAAFEPRGDGDGT